MKKIWLVVIGLVLLIGVVALVGCSAEGTGLNGGSIKVDLNSQQTGVWVSGEGKVTAVPDIAIINVGVDVQATTVAGAQATAAIAMDNIMTVLEEQGIAEEDIQTQYYYIQEVTRWDSDKEESITIGYRVTNTVTAKIRDIQKAGSVIDAVAAAGGDYTRISGISFSIDDPSPYYEQAREKAVADAAEKAKKLADMAGVELGNPTYISESSYYPGSIYRGDLIQAEAASNPTTPISAGEMEITATVQIAYAIVE